MTDEELDQQEQKEDDKEKRKQTIKVAITSSICTLLFIVILLLLILLGLKNCSKTQSSDNSSSSNEPTWTEYDNPSLNNVFKTIVNHQIIDYGFDDDTVSTIIAVSCTDADSVFTLDITAYSDSKVYYYNITNYAYIGSDNFVNFLLSYDFNTNYVLDGTVTLSLLEIDTNQTITNESITNEKHIIAKSAANKYLSGYYVDESNRFHVYQKLAITDGNNPYTAEADALIDYNSDLYCYYRFLNS